MVLIFGWILIVVAMEVGFGCGGEVGFGRGGGS